MPTDTFFNLSAEKRDKILDAAFAEFSTYTYEQSSIANIIKKAGIPRGSFYQYFEDKKDLYKYILEIIGQQKYEMLLPMLHQKKELGFYETLRELFKIGAKFFIEQPRLARIGELFMNDLNYEIRKEIYGENVPKGVLFYQELLKEGIENGEIDPDIDLELIAELLVSMGNVTLEHYLQKKRLDDLDDIMGEYEKMLKFIKDGIGK